MRRSPTPQRHTLRHVPGPEDFPTPDQATGRAGADTGTEAETDQDTASAVGRVLAGYLRQRTAESARLGDAFASQLADHVAGFTLGGGKRWRASFAWWGWRACGGSPRGPAAGTALTVASALELIQSCALIHDDLMDRSRLRRGAPALHVAFADRHRAAGMRGSPGEYGRSMAVLAGDLALAWADDMLADAGLDTGALLRVRKPWRAMRTEMVAGQFLDLHAQATGTESADTALRIAYLKSALYTVERPLALGAALAGAGPGVTDALLTAGRCAGLAFQLRDDLLGVFGDPELTGKPSGDDVREGKLTYPVAVALERADDKAADILRSSLGNQDLTTGELTRVREVLDELGARAATGRKIQRLTASALRALSHKDIDPTAAARLTGLVRRTGRAR